PREPQNFASDAIRGMTSNPPILLAPAAATLQNVRRVLRVEDTVLGLIAGAAPVLRDSDQVVSPALQPPVRGRMTQGFEYVKVSMGDLLFAPDTRDSAPGRPPARRDDRMPHPGPFHRSGEGAADFLAPAGCHLCAADVARSHSAARPTQDKHEPKQSDCGHDPKESRSHDTSALIHHLYRHACLNNKHGISGINSLVWPVTSPCVLSSRARRRASITRCKKAAAAPTRWTRSSARQERTWRLSSSRLFVRASSTASLRWPVPLCRGRAASGSSISTLAPARARPIRAGADG